MFQTTNQLYLGMGQYRYITSGLFTSINPTYDLGFTRYQGFDPSPLVCPSFGCHCYNGPAGRIAFRFSRSCTRRAKVESERLKPPTAQPAVETNCAKSCRSWSWTMEYLWNIYRIEYIYIYITYIYNIYIYICIHIYIYLYLYIWKILYIECCTKTGGLWDFSSKARERWGFSRNAHVHWTWLNTISAGTHLTNKTRDMYIHLLEFAHRETQMIKHAIWCGKNGLTRWQNVTNNGS